MVHCTCLCFLGLNVRIDTEPQACSLRSQREDERHASRATQARDTETSHAGENCAESS